MTLSSHNHESISAESASGWDNSKQIARRALDGTFWIMLSQSLLAPIGLIVVMYLTRRFGPAGYGQYALTWSVVLWLEITICMIFSRTAVRLVGEVDDWRPIGSGLLRWNLILGSAATLVLWLSADFIAAWLGDPRQATLIRLAAIDIPIAACAEAHVGILMGLGQFRYRSAVSAAR